MPPGALLVLGCTNGTRVRRSADPVLVRRRMMVTPDGPQAGGQRPGNLVMRRCPILMRAPVVFSTRSMLSSVQAMKPMAALFGTSDGRSLTNTWLFRATAMVTLRRSSVTSPAMVIPIRLEWLSPSPWRLARTMMPAQVSSDGVTAMMMLDSGMATLACRAAHFQEPILIQNTSELSHRPLPCARICQDPYAEQVMVPCCMATQAALTVLVGQIRLVPDVAGVGISRG